MAVTVLTTVNMVANDTQWRTMLNVLGIAGPTAGPLVNAHLILFTNDIIPGRNTVIGDLVEATFAGYAAGVLVWSAGENDSAGRAVLIGTPATFSPADAVLEETIYGVGITNTAETTLFAAERFATPVPLASPADSLTYVTQFRALVS